MKIGQSGEASWWRVWYQRGLPRLVYSLTDSWFVEISSRHCGSMKNPSLLCELVGGGSVINGAYPVDLLNERRSFNERRYVPASRQEWLSTL